MRCVVNFFFIILSQRVHLLRYYITKLVKRTIHTHTHDTKFGLTFNTNIINK